MKDPQETVMASPSWSRAARRISIATAVYALLGGALSFAGWVLKAPRLTDWIGSGITIKANACLAVSAAGLALLLFLLRPSAIRLIVILGVFTAALGGLTLLEHLTGWNFGIDTLLFDEPVGAQGTASPGRMGPPASASFLAFGVALAAMGSARRYRSMAVGLALGVFALALLSLVGYWFAATAMYTIPRLTGIALQTATLLAALSVGIITANPECQPTKTLIEESSAGLLARIFVPLALLVPLGLGWLRLAGQRHELYDAAFGTALRSVIEVVILGALLWWSVQLVRTRDHQSARVQEQLRQGERHLADLLESITDGFVAFDGQWRFTFANREALRLVGRSRDELEGRSIWELFPHVAGTSLHSELNRAMQDRTMVEIEGPGMASDGRELSHRAYPSASGGLSVFFQDITARRRTEEILKEADRRKDEFLATLAHELRNPLAPIRNASTLLLAQDTGNPMVRRSAEVINRQVIHMARLLEDLLDISRITRNRLELRREWVDIAAVIQSAVEASRPLIDAHAHELTVSVPNDQVYIDGDPVRLSQVLSNLLNNAAKYTDRGGHIALTTSVEEREVVLRVRDNGLGLDPALREHIFEMFVQAKSAQAHAQGGLGIGLSLARGLVELHGGSITAHSEGPGTGSEFIVRLPHVAGDWQMPQPATSFRGTTVSPRRRILIVDDQRDNADSLAMYLQMAGHDARCAYGGPEALEMVAAFQPEAVLLDIGMPGMDGVEVCRRIKASVSGRSICIAALTGWGQPADRRRTQEAGFDHHLIKPVEPGVVEGILASLPAPTPFGVGGSAS